MSNVLKSRRINYPKEMNEKFFCIMRRFINSSDLNMIINKIRNYEETYELEEGGNDYVSNENRRVNCLYSDFGDEIERLKKWPEEEREKLLDKYCNIRNDLGRDLIKILGNVFLLLRCNRWRILMVQKFDVYPGCNEQQIHMDMLKKNEGMCRYFISIPLHDTDIKMGPIIFYKEESLKEFRKYDNKYKENEDDIVVGYMNDLKWEIKQQFLLARYQTEYKFGDISIHRDMTYHSGGTNRTNRIRSFLFIICDAYC